ncbi:MAG TPA: glycosyltransferase family 4 protein [Candidatus Binatia bacterium]|nr:glycosyltransferase family 4 protein [Candidatus Binatia bacterium]
MTTVPPVIHLVMLKERKTHLPFSGAENHLLCLLPAQRAAGLTVELGILLRSGGPVIEETIGKLQQIGIAVSTFPYQPLIDRKCLGALRRHLAARRSYVVHTHLDHADLMGKVAARLAGCRRVVSTVHNDEPYHLRNPWFFTLRVLDRLTARHIAISEAVRRHLTKLERVREDKVTVVRYGIHPPCEVEKPQEVRARLGLPQDRFVIGFVGRLVEQKNVPLLLSAVARIPDSVCVVVGGGALRAELERQATQLGIDARFLGQLPNAEALMPAFDVLCLPSRWEGLGLVLLEAMVRKVPVVGSRAGAIPEILGGGEFGGLFDSGDVDGLVAAINAVRSEGPQRAARAYQHAVQSHTVDQMVMRTSEVYRSVSSG